MANLRLEYLGSIDPRYSGLKLDPRYSSLKFATSEQRSTAHEAILECLKKFHFEIDEEYIAFSIPFLCTSILSNSLTPAF